MSLDIWFQEDALRDIQTILIAHGPLTQGERQIVRAFAAAFGVLPETEHILQTVGECVELDAVRVKRGVLAHESEPRRFTAPFLLLGESEDIEL